MNKPEQIGALIDRILSYMSISEIRQTAPSYHMVELSSFANAEPLKQDWMSVFESARSSSSPDRVFFADAKPSDVGAFDIAWLGSAPDGEFSLQRRR